MTQAFEEHRAAAQRALSVIKQWLLVITFPFIVIGSSFSFSSEKINITSVDQVWLFSLPIGYRLIFIFSGILSLLLIFLHNDIDMHKNVCRNGMNSFRALYKTALKNDFEDIGWHYKMRTDFSEIKLNMLSFTCLFSLFGGFISGLYCAIGIGFELGNCMPIVWGVIVISSFVPLFVMHLKLSKENKKHGS